MYQEAWQNWSDNEEEMKNRPIETLGSSDLRNTLREWNLLCMQNNQEPESFYIQSMAVGSESQKPVSVEEQTEAVNM